MSALHSIVYKPENAPRAENAYTRLPLQEARLLVDHGIEGDLKGGSGDRQLNIMTAEAQQGLAAEGFRAAPGELGEQLSIAGLDVNTLPAGTRLQIGETACVELVTPRTGCSRFEAYQSKPPQQAAGRIGMMAKVVVGGVIRVGDPVTVLETAALAGAAS